MAKKKAARKKAAPKLAIAGSGDDPRQQYLDDEAAPARYEAIDKTIGRYEEILADQAALKEESEELRHRMIQQFDSEKINRYRYGGRIYELSDAGIKIKRRKAVEK